MTGHEIYYYFTKNLNHFVQVSGNVYKQILKSTKYYLFGLQDNSLIIFVKGLKSLQFTISTFVF